MDACLPSTLGKKTVLLFAVLTCMGILNWLIVYSVLGATADAADVMNAAGNLRMLARNVEIHVIQAAMGLEGATGGIESDRSQIDGTLRALEYGGTVLGVRVAGLSPEIMPLLAPLRNAWSEQLAVVNSITRKVAARADPGAEFLGLHASGDHVVASALALNQALTAKFDDLMGQARLRLALVAIADALVLMAAFMLTRAQVVLPLLKLAGVSGKLASGQHGVRTGYRSGDEVGRLAVAIDHMAEECERQIRQAEADLVDIRHGEEERRKLYEAVKHSPVSIVISDAQGVIEYVNPKFTEISGYTPEEVIGKNPRVWQSGETAEDVYRELWATIAAGKVWRGELLNRRKNGELFWEALSISAVYAEEGSISHYVAVKEDVTQHRKVQQALQTSEERFRSLTELSSDWVWEQDEQFRYTLRTDGKSTDEADDLIGRTRWDRAIIGISDEAWAAHKALLAAHQPFTDLEYQIKGDDGSVRWHRSSGIPIFDGDGNFKGYRGIGKDVTERKSTEQEIEFLAYHDTLTGLPNRLLVQDRFEQARAYADRARSKVALLYLDVDSFKTINDSLGHAIGDTLLKQIAVRLGECVRDSDTISRQGGDEFLIVLPDLPDADATAPALVKVMERLQEPFHAEGHELATSVSIGIALYPDDGGDFDTLLKKADMAMYRAKDAGRNAYRFFDEQMNVEAVEHLSMRNGLRRALDRGEFVLHYQPQITLASGAVVGAETLVRWNHPDLGMIPPARFIPVAEESGLIVTIGEWVMKEACRQAVAWRKAGLPELVVAVNLSAVQFKRGNVEQAVIGALEESGFDPNCLELEITESILIQDVENVLTTVQRLKRLGVKLSIDDFGTGYSSLSYLKRFAVDKLKIDQSFIRDLASDPDDAAIIRAIIQMAHGLNLKTIAEGVENAVVLEQLRIFRCDEVQGFHFARPMPADEFSRYLAESVPAGPVVPNQRRSAGPRARTSRLG